MPETVGKVAAMQRQYDGKQPGSPERAARTIIALASVGNPPLRLVLGSEAFERARRSDEAKLAELHAWRETSIATDFAAGEG